mmetsp:Transcript_95670/g.275680  ORF Transcript_95670/g.275680 Transcript_95670/m.275680 type:complete len:234 (-) Transcript_95670:410-1111(-)
MRSAEPTACAKSVDESTPASAPVEADKTIKWCIDPRAIFAAQLRTGSSETTARGTQWLCNPRTQFPTATDGGTCSPKARRASRGVRTPSKSLGRASLPSAISTQFCRVEFINSSACAMVEELAHTGSTVRCFMMSAAVVPLARRITSRSVQELQRARARSMADKMPRRPPTSSCTTSSRTTRCRKWASSLACSRKSLAASASVVDGGTVKASRMSPGRPCAWARNHSPMPQVG